MIAILHNIRSRQNVGSVFRTADAVGVSKIYLTGYTPTPTDEFGLPVPQLTKVSLGAENFVPWEKKAMIGKLLDRLKREGKKIYAVELAKNSIPYNEVRLVGKDFDDAVLVMGNEVRGLSSAILRRADSVLEIPMFGQKESLNVAVSFGIVAYGLRLGRQS